MRRPGQLRAALRWELIGAVFIVLAGSALHFAFGWSGGWRPLALVAAVNESIWEHLKLAFWPGIVWALLPRKDAAVPIGERLAARGFTLLLTAFAIVGVFTTYTAVLGRNFLALDIGTFALAVVLGQALAAWLTAPGCMTRTLIRLGFGLLALQLVAALAFTFHPPDFWLFIDSRNGTTGIPPG